MLFERKGEEFQFFMKKTLQEITMFGFGYFASNKKMYITLICMSRNSVHSKDVGVIAVRCLNGVVV